MSQFSPTPQSQQGFGASSDATSPRSIGNAEESTEDPMVSAALWKSTLDISFMQINFMRSIRCATAGGGVGLSVGMVLR